MKKFFAAAAAAAILAVFAGIVPKAVESMTPVCKTISPIERSYSDTISGSGKVRYADQSGITCSMPVVIKEMCVSKGDNVKAGDVIAKIDRESSAALLMSLSQVNALNAAAADLKAAAALIPESLVSDSEGKVVSVSSAGQAVMSGEDIAVIARDESIAVTAAVSELDISKLSIGQPAYFELSAYPDEKIFGTVSEISETARDQYSGTVLETVVDIVITPEITSDSRLRSGLSADVVIELSEPKTIVVCPYSAIEQDDMGEYVYVYENGEAVRRDIVTGKEFSDGTEVCEGLSADDIVFSDPKEIAERKYVRIKES